MGTNAINNMPKIPNQTGISNVEVQRAQQDVNSCFAGYTSASGTADTMAKASESAQKQVEVTSASTKALKSSLSGAQTALEGAQYELEQAKKNGGDTSAAEAKVTAAKQKLDDLNKQVIDAETASTKASADAESAAKSADTAKQAVVPKKQELDTAKVALDAVKTKAEQQAKSEPAPAAASTPTKTGGTSTTVTKEGSTTTTVKDNSPEFKAQEKENIIFADNLKRQYVGTNDLDAENSVDADKTSARTLQRKGLASVEYTPEMTTTLGKAEKYMDSVDSANNKDNASTAIVRDRQAAVNYYLDKTGVPKTEKGGYEPADVYAAEYAVSALQPAIVENAKKAEEYQAKFSSGKASSEERAEAVEMLKNGATFEGRVDRDVSQKLVDSNQELLNASEKDALIDKINSGKTDFTQRELNALTYLQGTTDVQGFPTVPKDMVWKLPTSFKSVDQVTTANAETYVCNFSSDGREGNNVKMLVEEGTDAYKIFAEGISKRYSDSMVGIDVTGNSVNSRSTDSNIKDMTSDYSVGDVTWQKLVNLAGSDGTLTAKELVDAGYMDAEVLSTLDNPEQAYEIHDLGTWKAVYSAEKMTDGIKSTGSTTLGAAKMSMMEETGGYAISGGNALSEHSMQSVKNPGGKNIGEFTYYDSKNGKPELKTVLISGVNARDDLKSLKEVARKNYEYFKKQGLL